MNTTYGEPRHEQQIMFRYTVIDNNRIKLRCLSQVMITASLAVVMLLKRMLLKAGKYLSNKFPNRNRSEVATDRRATTLNPFLVFRATSCPKALQLASQMEL